MKKTTKVSMGIGATIAAAVAIVGIWDWSVRERRSQNDRASLYTLKKISDAQTLYREGDADKNGTLEYAPSIEALAKHGLIPPELADGEDQGYTFWLERPEGPEAQFIWYGGADPKPGEGDRHLGVNMGGVLFFPQGERCKFAPDGSSTAPVLSGHGVNDLPSEPH
jgi:hypothetical protein